MSLHDDIMRAFGFTSAMDAEIKFAIADRERLEGTRRPSKGAPVINSVLAERIAAVRGDLPQRHACEPIAEEIAKDARWERYYADKRAQREQTREKQRQARLAVVARKRAEAAS